MIRSFSIFRKHFYAEKQIKIVKINIHFTIIIIKIIIFGIISAGFREGAMMVIASDPVYLGALLTIENFNLFKNYKDHCFFF